MSRTASKAARVILLTFLACGIVRVMPSSLAATQEVVIVEPQTVSTLSRIVTDFHGNPIPDVRVIETDRTMKSTRRTTKTDSEGRFLIAGRARGTFWLHFEADVFKDVLIQVKIRKGAPKEIKIQLRVAT